MSEQQASNPLQTMVEIVSLYQEVVRDMQGVLSLVAFAIRTKKPETIELIVVAIENIKEIKDAKIQKIEAMLQGLRETAKIKEIMKEAHIGPVIH